MVLAVVEMTLAVAIMAHGSTIMVRGEVIMVTAAMAMVHVMAIMALDEIKEDRFLQVFGPLTDGILIKADNNCLRTACREKLNLDIIGTAFN